MSPGRDEITSGQCHDAHHVVRGRLLGIEAQGAPPELLGVADGSGRSSPPGEDLDGMGEGEVARRIGFRRPAELRALLAKRRTGDQG